MVHQAIRPVKTYEDGTKELKSKGKFLDSIGVEYTVESLLKLCVLFIVHGFPSDIIMFCNDRVEVPLNVLRQLGVLTPLVCLFRPGVFWSMLRKKDATLKEDASGVRRVEPEYKLEYIYDVEAHQEYSSMGLCSTVTHHDDIEAKLTERKKNGLIPFKALIEELGTVFTAPKVRQLCTNPWLEQLFMLIYVYAKIYKKDDLKFLNEARLEKFYSLTVAEQDEKCLEKEWFLAYSYDAKAKKVLVDHRHDEFRPVLTENIYTMECKRQYYIGDTAYQIITKNKTVRLLNGSVPCFFGPYKYFEDEEYSMEEDWGTQLSLCGTGFNSDAGQYINGCQGSGKWQLGCGQGRATLKSKAGGAYVAQTHTVRPFTW